MDVIEQEVEKQETVATSQDKAFGYPAELKAIPGVGVDGIDQEYFASFYEKYSGNKVEESGKSLEDLLTDLKLMTDGNLNAAGALLFAAKNKNLLPDFKVIGKAFYGDNDDSDHNCRDSIEVGGRLAEVHEATVRFIMRHLSGGVAAGMGAKMAKGHKDVRWIWNEFVVNALVHRDYSYAVPINLEMFSDHVFLQNPLKIEFEDDVSPQSIIATYAPYLLPFTGKGEGLAKASSVVNHMQSGPCMREDCFDIIVMLPWRKPRPYVVQMP